MMIQKEIESAYHRMNFSKKQLKLTSVVRQGVDQFTKAIHIHLTKQHRSEDQEHTDLLNMMSAGEPICHEGLKNYKTFEGNDKDFEFCYNIDNRKQGAA